MNAARRAAHVKAAGLAWITLAIPAYVVLILLMVVGAIVYGLCLGIASYLNWLWPDSTEDS